MQQKLNQLLKAIIQSCRQKLQEKQQAQELLNQVLNPLSSTSLDVIRQTTLHLLSIEDPSACIPLTLTTEYQHLTNTSFKINTAIEALSGVEKDNRKNEAKHLYQSYFKILHAMALEVQAAKQKYNAIDKPKMIDDRCLELAEGLNFYRDQCTALRGQLREEKKALQAKVADNAALRVDNQGSQQLLLDKKLDKDEAKSQYLSMPKNTKEGTEETKERKGRERYSRLTSGSFFNQSRQQGNQNQSRNVIINEVKVKVKIGSFQSFQKGRSFSHTVVKSTKMNINSSGNANVNTYLDSNANNIQQQGDSQAQEQIRHQDGWQKWKTTHKAKNNLTATNKTRIKYQKHHKPIEYPSSSQMPTEEYEQFYEGIEKAMLQAVNKGTRDTQERASYEKMKEQAMTQAKSIEKTNASEQKYRQYKAEIKARSYLEKGSYGQKGEYWQKSDYLEKGDYGQKKEEKTSTIYTGKMKKRSQTLGHARNRTDLVVQAKQQWCIGRK